MGGSISKGNSRKICQIIQLAITHKAPYISLNDSAGARLDEGIYAMDGSAALLHANVMASGVIPQIAVILGPCVGVSCYSPALMDFVIMQKTNGQMFLTGPSVIEAATGAKISEKELGGFKVHMEKSGLAHFVCEDDKSCLNKVQELLDYIPQNCDEQPFWKEYPLADYSYRLMKVQMNRKHFDQAIVNKVADIEARRLSGVPITGWNKRLSDAALVQSDTAPITCPFTYSGRQDLPDAYASLVTDVNKEAHARGAGTNKGLICTTFGDTFRVVISQKDESDELIQALRRELSGFGIEAGDVCTYTHSGFQMVNEKLMTV